MEAAEAPVAKRLKPRCFQILFLADIADHGDDVAAVSFLQPRNDNRCIQPA